MDKILLRNITLDDSSKDILIADGKISRISPHLTGPAPSAEGAEIVDCTGKVAVPGFVNMHTHAAMTLMRGVGEDMVLEDWLDHIWAIEKHLDEPFIYWGTLVAALEMIKTGTTAFNDMYWFSPQAQKAAAKMGLRSLVSFTFLDNFNQEHAALQKDVCQEMFSQVPSWDPRSTFAVSIHSVYTVSEQTILWATEFARRNGLRIHIHVSETSKEVEDCKAAHGGLSPVAYLDSLGVLGSDVIAAHCDILSEEDIGILGSRKVNCVHNINSNAKLASGYKFKWKELSEAGANVCLGTDGAASSNNLDMLEAMKTTAFFQKAWREDPSALPLKTLLDLATVNGAKAIGANTGRIEEGCEADIQIIDTDSTFFLSPGPFLANFIYSAHSDCISSLISGGRFVMRDRRVGAEREILDGGKAQLRIIENYIKH